TISVARAQSLPRSGDPASQARVKRFEISPGPLSQVLPEFAHEAGITFILSPDSIGAVTSPGISGTFSTQEALHHLLDGDSVTFRFTAPTVVTFELRGLTQSVEVTAHAPGVDPYADPEAPYKADRLSSNKFAEPLMNTARTATVLTQEALEDK